MGAQDGGGDGAGGGGEGGGGDLGGGGSGVGSAQHRYTVVGLVFSAGVRSPVQFHVVHVRVRVRVWDLLEKRAQLAGLRSQGMAF